MFLPLACRAIACLFINILSHNIIYEILTSCSISKFSYLLQGSNLRRSSKFLFLPTFGEIMNWATNCTNCVMMVTARFSEGVLCLNTIETLIRVTVGLYVIQQFPYCETQVLLGKHKNNVFTLQHTIDTAKDILYMTFIGSFLARVDEIRCTFIWRLECKLFRGQSWTVFVWFQDTCDISWMKNN